MSKPDLIVYTLENCPSCKLLISQLKKLGIKYTEIDAQLHVDYLNRNGVYHVPALELDGQLFFFESLDQLMEMLDKQKHSSKHR